MNEVMTEQQRAEDLEKLDHLIDESKLKIRRMEALKRLEKNKDFKELIAEGFLKDHAVRQVMLKGHPGLQSDAHKFAIDQQITAIGGLKQFFIAIYTEGNNAVATLEADEQTREELLAEDVEN